MIGFLRRLVEAIKNQGAAGPSRSERRLEARTKGKKRSDGRFRGNPSSPKAIKQYRLDREMDAE